jgi:lipid II:glycine glycyltransferase (peptidoglycan interpeptide bridge formation enzyme)
VRKARKAGVEIKEVQDCSVFWPLLEDNLKARYDARPVHSLDEIALLKSRFPQHIRLFVACKDGRVVGGTLLYICARTVKTQYISANDEGRRVGALDLLFSTLLDKCSENGMEYFDFGTSNRPDNDDLNDSLIFQKEGFGGRAVCYDTYEYSL